MQARAATFGNDDKNLCETVTSAVAWPAIIAGALTAVAVTLVLLTLGSGFGLASMSPWPNAGVSAMTFTVTGAIWLVVTQWLSSALGGYLTGRLRCRWAGTPADEVFFRDTAHGFLAWVLATVLAAAVLASATAAVLGGTAQAATTVAAGAVAGAASQESSDKSDAPAAYFADSLFRSDRVNPAAPDTDVRAETAGILIRGMKNGDVPTADRAYLARLVSARTGLSQPEAEQRVDNVLTQMKAAEEKLRADSDTARKTAATISIFTALSMLVGAFIAAVAAALGGRQRDI